MYSLCEDKSGGLMLESQQLVCTVNMERTAHASGVVAGQM